MTIGIRHATHTTTGAIANTAIAGSAGILGWLCWCATSADRIETLPIVIETWRIGIVDDRGDTASTIANIQMTIPVCLRRYWRATGNIRDTADSAIAGDRQTLGASAQTITRNETLHTGAITIAKPTLAGSASRGVLDLRYSSIAGTGRACLRSRKIRIIDRGDDIAIAIADIFLAIAHCLMRGFGISRCIGHPANAIGAGARRTVGIDPRTIDNCGATATRTMTGPIAFSAGTGAPRGSCNLLRCAVYANPGPAFTLGIGFIGVVDDGDDSARAIADIPLAIAICLRTDFLAAGAIGSTAHTLFAGAFLALCITAGTIGYGCAMHNRGTFANPLVTALIDRAGDTAITAILLVIDRIGAGQITEGGMIRGTAIGSGGAGFATGDHGGRGTHPSRKKCFDRLPAIFPFCQLPGETIESILVHVCFSCLR